MAYICFKYVLLPKTDLAVLVIHSSPTVNNSWAAELLNLRMHALSSSENITAQSSMAVFLKFIYWQCTLASPPWGNSVKDFDCENILCQSYPSVVFREEREYTLADDLDSSIPATAKHSCLSPLPEARGLAVILG